MADRSLPSAGKHKKSQSINVLEIEPLSSSEFCVRRALKHQERVNSTNSMKTAYTLAVDVVLLCIKVLQSSRVVAAGLLSMMVRCMSHATTNISSLADMTFRRLQLSPEL